ncbi:MAG TPA: ABC transporter permease [Candidatus Acetothermia bacterium]|nr:ABC transporter permease [Candidatus Acetothermia bacterium]
MGVFKFLVKRLLFSAFVLLGLSILIFLISRVLPGDPVRMALGPRAPEWAVQQLREQMHLDKPLPVQYYYWLSGALRGDLGQSLFTRRAVIDDIKEFLPATMELALFAGLIMAVFGILFGAIAGRYSNTWIDNVVRIFSYIGVVTPSFVFAILFLLLFGYLLGWFPTAGRLSPWIQPPPVITGMVTLDSLITRNWAALGDALWHMVLPAVALALGGMAQEARITRATISDNLKKDYIASAKGFGVPERLVMLKYLLKPSLIPTVSILGLDFASLLGNAFLVELIFNWPGFSRYGINAMLRKDLNAIAAVVMVLGVVFVTVNILVDLVVAWLDPRIRLGAERGK